MVHKTSSLNEEKFPHKTKNIRFLIRTEKTGLLD